VVVCELKEEGEHSGVILDILLWRYYFGFVSNVLVFR
jgi:hypothetical protein